MDRARLPDRRNAKHASGRQWTRFARYVVDYYGGLCHICGHGGARTADHLIPEAENPDQEWRIEAFRPAHGAPGNPCQVCTAECGRPVYCNNLRGMGSVARARRIIAERKAANQGRKTPPEMKMPGARERLPDAGQNGREWLCPG